MSSGFEWLCLIPPLFIVVWAVITKKTFSALIIGCLLYTSGRTERMRYGNSGCQGASRG